jgi:hypothetical protein
MVERLSRAMRLPRALHGSASLALPFRADLKNLGVFAVQTLGIVHFLEDSSRRR